MELDSFTVTLKCFFCDAALEGDTEREFSSGDMLKCQNCGELNDYDSLLEVAKEEGLKIAKAQAEAEIKKKLGKLFK